MAITFKKIHKGKINLHSKNVKHKNLQYGQFGIKVLESGRLTNKHLETCRKAIRKSIRKTGRIWINCYASWPITSKPIGVRMGKGKGSVDYYVSKVNAGFTILEVAGAPAPLTLLGLQSAIHKLPLRACIVKPLPFD